MSVQSPTSAPKVNLYSPPPIHQEPLAQRARQIFDQLEQKESDDFEIISPEHIQGYADEQSSWSSLLDAIFSSISFLFPKQKPTPIVKEHVQALVDADFQKNVSSSFLRKGKWYPENLKTGIEKDLVRLPLIKINEQRINTFSELCESVGLPEFIFNLVELPESWLSPHQREIFHFMSLLQQGAMGDAMVCFHEQLVKQTEDLKLLHFCGDRDLILIVRQIIERKDLDECNKLCAKHKELPKYLSSAISLGLLDEAFLPDWKSIPEIPIHATRYTGTYVKGKTPQLTLDQDLLVARVTDRIEESRRLHINVQLQIGKPATISWRLY